MKIIDALRYLAEGLAEALWPTRCVGCDAPGTLLCPSCRAALPAIEQRYACPHCGAPFGRLVCTECTCCLDRSNEDAYQPGVVDDTSRICQPAFAALDGVSCYGIHEWPLDALIRAYKDAGERRASELLAGMLVQTIRETVLSVGAEALPDVLTFVPCTPAAFARRGFDHMERIAQDAAAQLGLPLIDMLACRTTRDQRRLGRQMRQVNVRGSFVVVAPASGARILLIDDVVTTGSTIGAAALALKEAGAERVTAAALARAWPAS